MNPGACQLCSESEAKIPRCPRGASVNHFLVSVSNTSTNYEDCKHESNSFTVGRPLEVGQHYYPIVWAMTQAGGGGLLEGAKCVDACRVSASLLLKGPASLNSPFTSPSKRKNIPSGWGKPSFFFNGESLGPHSALFLAMHKRLAVCGARDGSRVCNRLHPCTLLLTIFSCTLVENLLPP